MQNQIFSQKAHEFWQINGAFKTLHDINPVRLTYIKKFLELQEKKINQINILDCGCGAGILSESLANLGAQVTGLDLSPEVIEVAKNHAQQNSLNIKYFASELKDFKKQNKLEFDAIVCLEMLEHVENPESILQDLSVLLKKNGLLFLSTINRNWTSFAKAIVVGEYITNIIPKGTHHYYEFIKPNELDAVCRKNNLQLLDLSGLNYNPLTRKAKIVENCDTNYIACYLKK